jgi:hypothetical protein
MSAPRSGIASAFDRTRMCGRYTLTVDKVTIEHRFGAIFYVTSTD